MEVEQLRIEIKSLKSKLEREIKLLGDDKIAQELMTSLKAIDDLDAGLGQAFISEKNRIWRENAYQFLV